MDEPAAFPKTRLFVRAHIVPFPRPRIFPLFVSLSHSVLFDLNTTSCPFVLPMKSFAPIAFPERVQFVPALAAAQRALPEASDVRTYPFDAPERILSHWKVPVQATSSFEVGAVVPIPRDPLERRVIFPAFVVPIWTDPSTLFVIPEPNIIAQNADQVLFLQTIVISDSLTLESSVDLLFVPKIIYLS